MIDQQMILEDFYLGMIASISFISIWHLVPDFGDHYFGRHFLGVLVPIKNQSTSRVLRGNWCLKEESKLVGRIKTCFFVPYILGVLHTRVLLDYIFLDVILLLCIGVYSLISSVWYYVVVVVATKPRVPCLSSVITFNNRR